MRSGPAGSIVRDVQFITNKEKCKIYFSTLLTVIKSLAYVCFLEIFIAEQAKSISLIFSSYNYLQFLFYD